MWDISYANLNMLLATIPTYEPDKKKDDVQEVEGIDELANYLGL
jgi:hypothetical protein